MTTTLFTNAAMLDTEAGAILADRQVLVRDGKIAEVETGRVATAADRTVDLKGKVLMPGLCDAHVHVTAVTADLARQLRLSPFYVAAHTADILKAMLLRGFTTVRDAGGADWGLAQAVEEGVMVGPRILYCGHGLSQTGGHGDMRGPGEGDLDRCLCCAGLDRVCDGVTEVRRATRDEIRKGAHQIKIMAGGGVASPTDRIDSTQFSFEEIDAIVEEASAANLYVMAHAYTAKSINRLLGRGVRTIEHGNLLDEESCRLFLRHGAYLVPTMATYEALAKEGLGAGMPADLHRKVFEVLDAGYRALEMAHRAGVAMAFGSDLLGAMHKHQLNEFNIRKAVVPAADLIRAATSMAAEACMRQGEFGVIAVGARADLLVLDRNPLDDVTVLTQPELHLKAVMKAGRFHKDELR
ncbi:MAG TPA: amidohydrolase family protein [Kiloniellales bacterium]|nr:amidohydrolase family protein [Kiloniellales bacterium]